MGIKLGIDARLYYGNAGATAATLLNNVKEVKLGVERGASDVTTRSNGGWKAYKPGLKDADLEITVLADSADAGYIFLRTAFLAGTAVALAALDGIIGQGHGLDADWIITKFDRAEGIEDGLASSITVKPDCTLRNPAWI